MQTGNAPESDYLTAAREGRAAAPVRRIWLCADDYGLSEGVDRAIRDLVALGHLNATSVMVASPNFNPSEARELSSLNSGSRRVSIGLHLTMTGPFRPLTAFAPMQDGAFLPLTRMMLAAFMRRFSRTKLIAEIDAQIDRFADVFGAPPAFVDGHQHVHLLPGVREALLQVVAKRLPAAWVRQCGHPAPLPQSVVSDPKGHFLNWLSATFRDKARSAGVQTNPAFSGAYTFSENADFSRAFPRFLEGLPDGGVIMCHPGMVDAELIRLDPLTTLREREYAYFRDPAFAQMLASRGIALA